MSSHLGDGYGCDNAKGTGRLFWTVNLAAPGVLFIRDGACEHHVQLVYKERQALFGLLSCQAVGNLDGTRRHNVTINVYEQEETDQLYLYTMY